MKTSVPLQSAPGIELFESKVLNSKSAKPNCENEISVLGAYLVQRSLRPRLDCVQRALYLFIV